MGFCLKDLGLYESIYCDLVMAFFFLIGFFGRCLGEFTKFCIRGGRHFSQLTLMFGGLSLISMSVNAEDEPSNTYRV